ncbi:MAG: substrate-binding domain-containing protein [Nitrososphaera sp.]
MASKIGLLALMVAATISIIVIALVSLDLTRTPQPPGEPPSSATDSGNNTKPEKTTVNLVSTRSAFPFVQRWVTQYNNDDHAEALVKVTYLEEATAGIDDLRIVDSSAVANNDTDSYYVPVSAQVIAIVYNVPGFPDIPSGLRLDNDTLYLILNGTIARWNDRAIANLNKDLNLPNEKIIVVHERGNNGSLNLIKRSITKDFTWPIDSIEASGPDDLGTAVRTTPYSIGYIDFSYAIQTKMTYAATENARGQYVIPSTDSIGEAAESGLEVRNATNGNLVVSPPVINVSRLGDTSYSLVGLYYFAFDKNTRNDTIAEQDSAMLDIRRNATLDFVKWVIANEGQRILSEVGYPDLYHGNVQLQTYAGNIISYSYSVTVSANSTRLTD